jgi:hypothetical protein
LNRASPRSGPEGRDLRGMRKERVLRSRPFRSSRLEEEPQSHLNLARRARADGAV